MKKNNPLISALMLGGSMIVLLSYLSTAHYFNASRGAISPPEWLTLARKFIYLITAVCFVLPLILRKYLLKRSKNEEKDPSLIIIIIGFTFYLIPSFLSFIQFKLGGPIIDLYIFTGLSFLGLILWSFYNHSVFKIDRSQISYPIISYTGSYTAVLIILGFIMAGMLAIKFYLLIHPTEYSSYSSNVPTIPIYVFIMIGSWVTAILRLLKSPYAHYATMVFSIACIFSIPFGTLTTIYWFLSIRKKEMPNNSSTPDSGHSAARTR